VEAAAGRKDTRAARGRQAPGSG